MFGNDLFGGKTAQEQAHSEKVPETTPQDATGLLAEVKSKETPQVKTPQRKSIKFKTAQGTNCEISYIIQGNEDKTQIEMALKQICEAVLNGEITPEAE